MLFNVEKDRQLLENGCDSRVKMCKEAVVTYFEKRMARKSVKIVDISRYHPSTTRKIVQNTNTERYCYASLTGRRIGLHNDMVCVHLTANPLVGLQTILWPMDCSFFHDSTAQVRLGLLIPIVEFSRSHTETPHSVGLLWKSDQPVAETSTWQHATITKDRQPQTRRDSNRQSQQTSGSRPTP
jgi:hypothetical protein